MKILWPGPGATLIPGKFLLAAIMCCATCSAARAQHHVEYGLNLSLGPNIYYEHYEQGEQPGGAIIHQEMIDGYGQISGQANVGFGVNKARIELNGTNSL